MAIQTFQYQCYLDLVPDKAGCVRAKKLALNGAFKIIDNSRLCLQTNSVGALGRSQDTTTLATRLIWIKTYDSRLEGIVRWFISVVKTCAVEAARIVSSGRK